MATAGAIIGLAVPGVEIDDITETVAMDEFAAVPLYDELHSKNVFKAYQLLEWEE